MTKFTIKHNNLVFNYPSYSIGKTLIFKIKVNDDSFDFGYSLKGLTQEAFANYPNKKVWQVGSNWKTRIRTYSSTKYKILSASEVVDFKDILFKFNPELEELITGEHIDPTQRLLR